jgi:hypothetical protein
MTELSQLKEEGYDDSLWTSGELQALAWQAGKQAGLQEMAEYDGVGEEDEAATTEIKR